jgi:hypothetical protein
MPCPYDIPQRRIAVSCPYDIPQERCAVRAPGEAGSIKRFFTHLVIYSNHCCLTGVYILPPGR